MYVDVSTVRHGTRTYTRFLLRESFRDNGKVKHRTIANLSQCAPQEIEAIRLALRHKENL
ncbi:MAG: IS1634 family transposase, partial [Gammaproteobacteria bacterium]